MKKIAAACAFVALFLPACVASDAYPVGDSRFGPRPADWHIDVYVSRLDPPALREFGIVGEPEDSQEIGVTHITLSNLYGNMRNAVDRAVRDSRALGGDSVVLEYQEGGDGVYGQFSKIRGLVFRRNR